MLIHGEELLLFYKNFNLKNRKINHTLNYLTKTINFLNTTVRLKGNTFHFFLNRKLPILKPICIPSARIPNPSLPP